MKIDLIVLPYDSADADSLLSHLIQHLACGRWTRFRAAVAFARITGNVKELLDALQLFAQNGNEIQLTFGADTFGPESEGSDYDAIETIFDTLKPYPHASVSLYHEPGRTFHPKIYCFDNEEHDSATIIIGSSNWSRGGLFENVEASIAVTLDLSCPEQFKIYAKLDFIFRHYWSEHE